jgi:hypothetical protein
VTVRASSVNWSLRLHPAYVVSGRLGTAIEKWSSAATDRAPWIEVEFDRPRRVERVDLMLAGMVEKQELTMREFSFDCFAGARVVASLVVRNNENANPHFALACDAATRVRVTFVAEPTEPRDVARLYGLQIWGSS